VRCGLVRDTTVSRVYRWNVVDREVNRGPGGNRCRLRAVGAFVCGLMTMAALRRLVRAIKPPRPVAEPKPPDSQQVEPTPSAEPKPPDSQQVEPTPAAEPKPPDSQQVEPTPAAEPKPPDSEQAGPTPVKQQSGHPRLLALCVLCFGALLGAVSVVEVRPPHGPISAVTFETKDVYARVGHGTDLRVTVSAPTWRPFRCNPWVRVEARVYPSDDFVRRSRPDPLDKASLLIISVAKVAIEASVSRRPLDASYDYETSETTDLRNLKITMGTRAEPADEQSDVVEGNDVLRSGAWLEREQSHVARFNHRTVFDDIGSPPLTARFEARWAATRGAWSCWVRLPQLTGDLNANDDPHATTSVGLNHVVGATVLGDRSLPGPTAPAAGWTCRDDGRPSDQGFRSPTADDCSAWAATEPPWRSAARDAALLLTGVLLSLGFEILVSARRTGSLARIVQ
jgi:hypothetical protein